MRYLLAVLTLGIALSASAQVIVRPLPIACMAAEAVLAKINERGESRVWQGAGRGGRLLVSVYENSETGAWIIIAESPAEEGVICIVNASLGARPKEPPDPEPEPSKPVNPART